MFIAIYVWMNKRKIEFSLIDVEVITITIQFKIIFFERESVKMTICQHYKVEPYIKFNKMQCYRRTD